MVPDDRPLSLDPADYEDVDIDDPDNPELTDEDFARGRPMSEVFGHAFVEKWQAQRADFLGVGGDAVVMSAEVVDFYAALGGDWRSRMNADLEDLVRIKKRR